MKHRFILLTSLCLYISPSAQAKLESVNYDLLCMATIDTKEISKKEYEAIYQMSLPNAFSTMLWGDGDFHKALEDTKKPNLVVDAQLKKMTKDYKKNKRALENLPIGKKKFWKEVRKERLKYIEAEYEFASAQLKYLKSKNSKEIVKIVSKQKIGDKCDRYLNALKDLESLKTFAPTFIKEECAKNGTPDVCLQEMAFDESSEGSQARLRYRIINLGLFNCADFSQKKSWGAKEDAEIKKLVRDVQCNNQHQ